MRRPSDLRASLSVGIDATHTLAPTGLGSPRLHRFCFGLLPVSFPQQGKDRPARDSGKPLGRCVSRSSSFAPWSFGPSLQRHYPPSSLLWPLLTSPSLSRRSSPQVRRCFFPFIPSGSTSHVSDGHWASLWPASLPPVRSLSAGSCSYGRKFVPRFLQLLALRFPTVTSIGSGEYVATHKKTAHAGHTGADAHVCRVDTHVDTRDDHLREKVQPLRSVRLEN